MSGQEFIYLGIRYSEYVERLKNVHWNKGRSNSRTDDFQCIPTSKILNGKLRYVTHKLPKSFVPKDHYNVEVRFTQVLQGFFTGCHQHLRGTNLAKKHHIIPSTHRFIDLLRNDFGTEVMQRRILQSAEVSFGSLFLHWKNYISSLF